MKKIIIIISILCAGMAFAQTNAAKSPVKIQANSMQYYGNQNKSSFKGQVVATSSEYTLTADAVDVFFTETNEVSKIGCQGNVNFKSTDILAVSNTANLDQNTKIIELSGEVKIWQGENYLEGENVNIQYETKEIIVDKKEKTDGEDERVIIIFGNTDDLSIIK